LNPNIRNDLDIQFYTRFKLYLWSLYSESRQTM